MKRNQHSIKLDIDDSQMIEIKALRLLKKYLMVTPYKQVSIVAPKFLTELSSVIKNLEIDPSKSHNLNE
jgi:hypothetical protein